MYKQYEKKKLQEEKIFAKEVRLWIIFPRKEQKANFMANKTNSSVIEARALWVIGVPQGSIRGQALL